MRGRRKSVKSRLNGRVVTAAKTKSVSWGRRLDLPSRVLVVSRRKTERGTDTDEGEEGIMLQAAEAVG